MLTTVSVLKNNSIILFVCSFYLDCINFVGIVELNVILALLFSVDKKGIIPILENVLF